jgi:mono/diheme cytochrome c family protein
VNQTGVHLALAALLGVAARASGQEVPLLFERDVRPLLAKHCLACHGGKTRANLDLRTVTSMLRGGDGGPALVRGQPEASPLIDLTARREMPPGKKPKLAPTEVDLLRRWVRQGAPAKEKVIVPELVSAANRAFWSFQRLAPRLPPAVKNSTRVRTAVDAFLAAKLAAKGLDFGPDAARTALIRRLSFDLTGLPPAPAEVEAFLKDNSPDAYEKVVDRLLGSPHFGERWARHWLDAAGYVDVLGTDNDAGTVKLSPGKWRYRDYVVRAFNEDKPFNRFLTEQLAGDELAAGWRGAKQVPSEAQELLVATGFLRVAADDTDERELNTPDIRHRILQQTGEIVAGNLLALTVQCAKCHNHKYDPLPQRDYYRLLAVLSPAFNPEQWRQPKERQLPGDIQAVFDVGPPSPTRVLRRGEHDRPAYAVEPGLPAVLAETDEQAILMPANAPTSSSGRRLELARRLTDPSSRAGALVARVRVNRIWQHLFGRGIVATSENLGRSGSRPTHPELLDWLAGEFVRGGWRTKPLIRLLVTSTAYRQAAARPMAPAADPDNTLLWRMRLRRLESECVRDALLAVSGRLDRSAAGPPSAHTTQPDGRIVVPSTRRSLYLLGRRNYHPTLLGVFDQPVVATNCTGRMASAVVTQSLTMLNDAFVLEQANHFAARVAREAGPDSTKRVERAFLLALARRPTPAEAARCVEFLRRQGSRLSGDGALAQLCHTLLCSNEFLYLD